MVVYYKDIYICSHICIYIYIYIYSPTAAAKNHPRQYPRRRRRTHQLRAGNRGQCPVASAASGNISKEDRPCPGRDQHSVRLTWIYFFIFAVLAVVIYGHDSDFNGWQGAGLLGLYCCALLKEEGFATV